MSELGAEPSVVGVARMYRDIAATLVVDRSDAARAGEVEALGVRCVVAPTVMRTAHDAEDLSTTVLDAVSGLIA
jgi:LPPG:FO 2-phospho-L-lactate transferase